MSAIDDMIKTEREFCESSEVGLEKNEKGVYVYISQCGHSRISLDFILYEYKQWLIENEHIKLI